jgi:cation diffusion facilitator CzcD-associated flavoprotein CzcO/short-subunit dehydrogenase
MECNHFRVIVVGGGVSGIGVGIRLLEEGVRDFAILEKADRLGGTWRENTYPGCACDVPSHLYSFSFAPNPEWSRVFASGDEIQRYVLDVARRNGIEPFVRHGVELRAARWSDAAERWELETSRGAFTAQVLVTATGPLHDVKVPDLPGLDRFEGVRFHSARWRHDVDLRGRKVAVLGTGSSSIQLVPEVQPLVERLTLFQRTPAWVLPKLDHEFPPAARAAFRRLPGVRRAYRGAIYYLLELLQLAERRPETMRVLERIARAHLERQVPDPVLRERLTPGFVLGCKRILFSNSYYPALQRPNARLVPCGAARVTPRGVVGADGVEHEADVIVFATGFHVTDPAIAERVYGRSGRSLAEEWRGSPKAYLGTVVAGFPNYFFMIGPNLGNGHGSAFEQVEAQSRYIAGAVRALEAEGLSSLEVRRGVQEAYDERVQRALAGTVWNAGGCRSYYLDRNGRNSSIYPWSTIHMRERLSRFDRESFVGRRARPAAAARSEARPGALELEGAVVAVTGAARGIGLAVARAFAARGASVALGDLDLEEARRAAASIGGRARAYPLDVTRRASFEAFLAALEADLGPADVLVNNAGVMPTGAFLEMAEEAADAVMRVNYEGTALGMRVFLPGMVERGRGHVANVISMAGKLHVPGLASYVASKHAAVGLSAAVRAELRGSGVTVSAVLPGAVRTRLSDGIPLGGIRAIEPEAVAEAVVETCRTREAEVAVPRWLGLYPLLRALAPESLMDRLRDAVGDARVLEERVAGARRAYEAALARQGRRRSEEARPDASPATAAAGTEAGAAGR